jgi:hypothetical protein
MLSTAAPKEEERKAVGRGRRMHNEIHNVFFTYKCVLFHRTRKFFAS